MLPPGSNGQIFEANNSRDGHVSSPMSEHPEEAFERRFGEPAEAIAPLKGDASRGGCTDSGRIAHGDRRRWTRRPGEPRISGVLPPLQDVRPARAGDVCGRPRPGDLSGRGLGDTTLFQFLTTNRTEGGFSKEVLELYRKVVDWLPRFRSRPVGR